MFHTSPLPFICTSCLRFQSRPPIRRFLATSGPETPPLLDYANALLTNRRLISITGQDASRFLQGLTTANIPSVAPSAGTGLSSAFLTATGRVLYDVFIYGTSGAGEGDAGFFIEVDAQEVQRLQQHLRRFKLRAKIAIRVLDEGERGIWTIRKLQDMPASRTKAIGCRDTRAPGMGYRLVLRGDEKPFARNIGLEGSVESYTAWRMLKGVAEGQIEIQSGVALPLECNMDLMGAIDFHKGCYLGQELTIRTRHTGVVRKRILPLFLHGTQSRPENFTYNPKTELRIPPPGAVIVAEDQPRARARVGKWLAGVGNIGLAMCRLEHVADKVPEDSNRGDTPPRRYSITWDLPRETDGAGTGGESMENGSLEGREAEGGSTETYTLGAWPFVPEWHSASPAHRHSALWDSASEG